MMDGNILRRMQKVFSDVDESERDGFGRKRVSSPDTVFDAKHLYGLDENVIWLYEDTTGGSYTWLPNEASVLLETTVDNGSRIIKQTRRYFPYIPAKSHLVFITGVFGTSQTNCTKRMGLFDDRNGPFFYDEGGTFGVCVRSYVTGTASDVLKVPQSEFNQDKLDGTGKSKFDLDLTKGNIFFLDLEWLGIGVVRFGVVSENGELIYCHYLKNANLRTGAYMQTSSLPIRYEIQNTGVCVSGNSMKAICCSVISEGGGEPSGAVFIDGNKSTKRNVTTRFPILAIRLADTYNTLPNRIAVQFMGFSFWTEDQPCFFEVDQVTDASTISGGTWSVVDIDGGCEINRSISTVSGGHEHIISDGWAVAGGSGAVAFSGSGKGLVAQARNYNNFITQDFDSNNSQMFVVFATSMGTATDVCANLQWQEIY